MFTADELSGLRKTIHERTAADFKLLDQLREEVRPLRSQVRRIQERSTTAVSLVASDGGNNALAFDPFYVQLVRVVDSYGEQLFLGAASPTTDTDELSDAQFDGAGQPISALGRMMRDLGVRKLYHLSPTIPSGKVIRENPERVKPGWVVWYRDLCEWATLYDVLCYRSFGTDTLVVRDGLLRSKIFTGELFMQWRARVAAAMDRTYSKSKRRVYLVGLAKHSKVLSRYRLAMALENTMPSGDPCYVAVPRDLEVKSYRWREFARGAEAEEEEGEAPKFVIGEMNFVRFGTRDSDPIWPVDLLQHPSHEAQTVFGYLLADATQGFPIPCYPRCLQRAHENAEVVGFDLELLQDTVYDAVRGALPTPKRGVLDAFRLNPDPSGRRYE